MRLRHTHIHIHIHTLCVYILPDITVLQSLHNHLEVVW